ncbi:YGGT family protein [Corynebacterium atrinae]|uniref:YggT family protein n=1 Tax=Corynebacterium atrinae TaxID=1336740 RepID=UPI0025B2EB74|nr:YggT family protein [Corynebacterium atrinae]WJY63804.1 YGGT family protein [Corynebacterium atrinae]
MTLIGTILYLLLRLYSLVLVARIVIEMIRSFSREFQPPQWFYYVAEPIFVVTDPPVKALRRIIPPLRLGGVALDMSVIVLFFVLMILQMVVLAVF